MPWSTASRSWSLPASAWTMRGGGAPALTKASPIAAASAEPHLCVRVTCAPRLPKARPAASPMPRVPPVTSTARPADAFPIFVLDAPRRAAERDLVHERFVRERGVERASPRQRQHALERGDRLAWLV